MHNAHFDGSFAGWREVARALLQQGVPPHQVNWLGDGPEARFVAQVNGAGILGPVQGQCLVHEDLVVSLVCMR